MNTLLYGVISTSITVLILFGWGKLVSKTVGKAKEKIDEKRSGETKGFSPRQEAQFQKWMKQKQEREEKAKGK